jgi:murein DD-endopeptidase MepM/ murein hydrolase activator NlpD
LKDWVARSIVGAGVAALAVATLVYIQPVPTRRAAELLEVRTPAPSWTERLDTLERGETLTALLQRSGLSSRLADQAIRALPSLDPRRVPAGMRVSLGSVEGDTVPSKIVLHLGIDHLLHLTRGDSGWVGREERLPWTTDTTVVHGVIRSNLYAAIDSAMPSAPSGARAELAWSVADIFEYRVDMSRDLQDGDAFRVLVERSHGPQGAVRMGRVLAARFATSGKELQAIRHEASGRRPRYFDQEGKSLHTGFLRAPLAFRRISSVFGMRRHPILGVWRKHAGTDYAASSGTPVRSVGDGVVIFSGRRGGYGNAIDVRHTNGYVSRYAHLRGFARGVRSGTRVSLGETIGYVGATGLATAPHLHFEVLVGGTQRNPRVALANKSGEPIPASERDAFDRTRTALLALLDRNGERLATND